MAQLWALERTAPAEKTSHRPPYSARRQRLDKISAGRSPYSSRHILYAGETQRRIA